MQLLIDTADETVDGLLAAAHTLLMVALNTSAQDSGQQLTAMAALEGMANPRRAAPRPAQQPAPPPVGAPVTPAAPAPLPENHPAPPPPPVHPERHPDAPPPPPPGVPAGTEPQLDPAQVFRQPAAPAAPTAPAPTPPPPASAPAAASPASDIPRDKNGHAWDERIHSETRKKNADGTWRYRRNLDAAVKAAVTAELNGPLAALEGEYIPAAPPPPPPGSFPASPPPPPPSTVLSFPGAATVPVPPAVQMGLPVAPPPGEPVRGNAPTFRDLMTKVNRALAAQQLTQAQLAEACKAVLGSETITALASQPMKVPDVDAYLSRWIPAAA